MTRVKICGITRLHDAHAAVALGVDTLGINFWHGTKRRCDPAIAAQIARELGDRVELVAVFVDEARSVIDALLRDTGIRWAQLHGDEPPEEVARLLPYAYKALGVGTEDPLERVRAYPGEHVLLDAAVPNAMPGGTGVRFDWALATRVAAERKLTLAGGLRPQNVAEAVRTVRPYRVDCASGVESSPGVKDEALVAAFVDAVRSADATAVVPGT